MISRRPLMLATVMMPSLAVAQTALAPLFAGPVSRQNRVAIAQDWSRRFTALDDAIPTLSPREEEWLRREYDDELRRSSNRFTERLLNAMDSREYRIRTAKGWISGVRTSLGHTLNPFGIQHEILNWSLIVQYFTDTQPQYALFALSQQRVFRADRLPFLPDGIAPTREIFLANVITQGHYVQRNIVAAYLWNGLPS